MSLSAMKLSDSNPKQNLLLARLAPEDYAVLTRGSKVVTLKHRKRVYRQDEPITFVYFPITCVASLLVTEGSKPSMEMATVGQEGVIGASELIQGQGAMGLSIIQIRPCGLTATHSTTQSRAGHRCSS
jgi:hypothetical protein